MSEKLPHDESTYEKELEKWRQQKEELVNIGKNILTGALVFFIGTAGPATAYKIATGEPAIAKIAEEKAELCEELQKQLRWLADATPDQIQELAKDILPEAATPKVIDPVNFSDAEIRDLLTNPQP